MPTIHTLEKVQTNRFVLPPSREMKMCPAGVVIMRQQCGSISRFTYQPSSTFFEFSFWQDSFAHNPFFEEGPNKRQEPNRIKEEPNRINPMVHLPPFPMRDDDEEAMQFNKQVHIINEALTIIFLNFSLQGPFAQNPYHTNNPYNTNNPYYTNNPYNTNNPYFRNRNKNLRDGSPTWSDEDEVALHCS